MKAQQLLPVVIFLFTPGVLPAQRPGAGTVPVGGGAGGARTGTTPGLPPGRTNGNSPTDYSGGSSAMFVAGKVVMDDGGPVPTNVVIERNCRGARKPLGYVDRKGGFSVSLGGSNSAAMTDASYDSEMGNSRQGSTSPQSLYGQGSSSGQNPASTSSGPNLSGCEIQAAYAGFQSSAIALDQMRRLDNPNIGTLILHRPKASSGGATVSASTLAAPKDAVKAYEKGLEAVRKNKLVDAQKEFQKAVAAYPEFSGAWYELGKLEAGVDRGVARSYFQKSLAADPKFVLPYLEVAGIDIAGQNWVEARDVTAKAILLDPSNFPQFYFYNAVAQYNLKDYGEAEAKARQALKLDPGHRVPKAMHLMGAILAQKGDLTGAREQLQAFLETAPGPADTEVTRKQLAEIDIRLSAKAK